MSPPLRPAPTPLSHLCRATTGQDDGRTEVGRRIFEECWAQGTGHDCRTRLQRARMHARAASVQRPESKTAAGPLVRCQLSASAASLHLHAPACACMRLHACSSQRSGDDVTSRLGRFTHCATAKLLNPKSARARGRYSDPTLAARGSRCKANKHDVADRGFAGYAGMRAAADWNGDMNRGRLLPARL